MIILNKITGKKKILGTSSSLDYQQDTSNPFPIRKQQFIDIVARNNFCPQTLLSRLRISLTPEDSSAFPYYSTNPTSEINHTVHCGASYNLAKSERRPYWEQNHITVFNVFQKLGMEMIGLFWRTDVCSSMVFKLSLGNLRRFVLDLF